MHTTPPSTIRFLILTFLLAVPSFAFAAGGTCPSAASYLNPSNPAGAKVTLASLGVTNCYYVAANGSDSNDGLSEASGHPWLHAPGMKNCTADCASNTPAASDGYIFRGGDTWHIGNSGASPYTGGTWSWTWSGNSSNSIYIGVDQSWYSGGSWVRPIMNGDNPLSSTAGSGAGVSSCTYGGGGQTLFSANPARYYHLDNFEWTGMCWGASGADFIFTNGVNTTYTQGSPNPNPRWIENNYIHGWSHLFLTSGSAPCTSSGGTCASGGGGIDGASGIPSNGAFYGAIVQFNVIDGSDSDYYSLAWCGNVGDTWTVQYNVVRYNGADNSPLSTHLFHDNLFEYGYNSVDGQTHTDWPLQNYGSEPNGGTFPGDGTPNLFYNNIVRHIPSSVSSVLWQFPGGSMADYDFNNIFSDYEGSGNYNNVCQGGCGNLVLFNNTEEGQGAPSTGGCIYCNGDASGSTIMSVNNHWVVNGGSSPSDVFQATTGVTESSAVYQTLSAANGQGYTVANNFSPSSATNSTVTASGVNETTGYCADSVLHNSLAEAACLQGITSVSYNATTHAVVYPAYTPVARPSSGAWNVGAYQFGSDPTAPIAPTNLSAVAE
jgi:hypothetical protein